MYMPIGSNDGLESTLNYVLFVEWSMDGVVKLSTSLTKVTINSVALSSLVEQVLMLKNLPAVEGCSKLRGLSTVKPVKTRHPWDCKKCPVWTVIRFEEGGPISIVYKLMTIGLLICIYPHLAGWYDGRPSQQVSRTNQHSANQLSRPIDLPQSINLNS